jgi:hypothetical protein
MFVAFMKISLDNEHSMFAALMNLVNLVQWMFPGLLDGENNIV